MFFKYFCKKQMFFIKFQTLILFKNITIFNLLYHKIFISLQRVSTTLNNLYSLSKVEGKNLKLWNSQIRTLKAVNR